MQLALRLSKNPLSLFPVPWTIEIAQMLEIFSEDLRPEVRQAACADLEKLGIAAPVGRCQPGVGRTLH